MLWIVVKNNFKLMFRNKLILVMMTFAPILVISALCAAFHGLLNNEYDSSSFEIGYFIHENSVFAEYKEPFLEACREHGIVCTEFSEDMAEQVVEDGTANVFLLAEKQGCWLYSTNPEGIETRICRYMLSEFEKNVQIAKITINNLAEEKSMPQEDAVHIQTHTLPSMKVANAEDYYGIIEIVYFLFFGVVFLTTVVQSERTNKINHRFRVSSVSKRTLYLGKFIPCQIMTMVCSAITVVLATFLFGIHWGNVTETIGILLLTSLSGTAIGIFLLYLVDNLALSIVLLFVITWVWGFLGGSFETYMYSRISESMKRSSPIYYVNRTLVEYSTMGQSGYDTSCVLILLAVTVVCIVAGGLLMNQRKEKR